MGANTSGIIPFDKRVLVLHDPVSDKFEGTSLLRPDAEKDKQKYAQTRATVIAVGDAAWAEAKYDAQQFGIASAFPAPGDRVLVGRYTGDVHKGADGTDYVVINDTDVIAFIASEGK
jgi:co-chaperonin GroES (HSP10)